jgi:hypothetical protein
MSNSEIFLILLCLIVLVVSVIVVVALSDVVQLTALSNPLFGSGPKVF